MAQVDFIEAARLLSKEFAEQGYKCRLDRARSHPRLYIGYGGAERFTILSSTANYDTGDLLQMKRKDIIRGVLPNIPKPPDVKVPTVPNDQKAQKPTLEVETTKVFPITIFIMGKGILVVQIPKEAVPEHATRAQIQTFPTIPGDVRIGILFSPEHGSKPSTKSNAKVPTYRYHFARDKVPFKYTDRQPTRWKAPKLCCRRMNDSLVCDGPLPKELLVSEILTSKKTVLRNSEYSVEEGSELRAMLNDWVAWARAKGHEPELSVTDEQELCISITTKEKKTL